ncbi:MAG: single-stranded-DNA-specific exonuclease RecJ [Bacteroidia bacterium]|nr:single-stranded-DNA-specific exonuclease RecJ [Bacteroidia bacterium]
MNNRWNLLPHPNQAQAHLLSIDLGVPPLISRLLVQRGVHSFEDARRFFRPALTDLHNPFLMRDMDKAVQRIEQAIAAGEKILVYGDYDVDGTTAVALMWSYLQSRGANAGYYIPDRYKEGYGISFAGIEYAAAHGYSLIVALDCGIKSTDKVEFANGLRVDFIICDHHRPGNELPAAVAVLDPKRNDCAYPFDELTGCGIGFKLIQALEQQRGIEVETLAPYLDLVAVSIAADIVPMTGENRVLTTFGLERLNTAPRPGFAAILRLAKPKAEITVSDLVFLLAPRINAAGRVQHGTKAVELLVAANTAQADAEAEIIQRHNTERKDLDIQITREALEELDLKSEWTGRKSTVLFNSNWHKGVVGIVASRLIDRYYRPTIVLTAVDGVATGSARSVRDFDVYEAIEACADLLIQFGGHKYAAGLTLKTENVELFRSRFEEVVSRTITPEQLIPEITIDAPLPLDDIDPKTIRLLRQFAPFGPGNMNPVFMARGVADRGWARVVGNNHLKADFINPAQPNRIFPAIGFGLGPHHTTVQRGNLADICYTIEENTWNNTVSLQLNVKDIRPA